MKIFSKWSFNQNITSTIGLITQAKKFKSNIVFHSLDASLENSSKKKCGYLKNIKFLHLFWLEWLCRWVRWCIVTEDNKAVVEFHYLARGNFDVFVRLRNVHRVPVHQLTCVFHVWNQKKTFQFLQLCKYVTFGSSNRLFLLHTQFTSIFPKLIKRNTNARESIWNCTS